MKHILNWLAKLIMRRPVKLITISVVVIMAFAVGAKDMQLATGNRTLVETTTKAYKDNQALEDNFGGESIIVLYQGNNFNNLLTPKTISQMNGLEEELSSYDGTYSIISPNTIIKQISKNQYRQYHDGLHQMSEGLDKMGHALSDMSQKLNSNPIQRGQSLSIDQQLTQLNNGFDKVIHAQNTLANGTSTLVNGYRQFAKQLDSLAVNMRQVNNQLMNSTTAAKSEKVEVQQIDGMITKLVTVSKKMVDTSVKSADLPKAAENTSRAIKQMKTKSKDQVTKLSNMNKQFEMKTSNLKEVANHLSDMGIQLTQISHNIDNMLLYSDDIVPELPTKQSTLNHLIYNGGKLRTPFNRVILKNNMLFIIKLSSHVDQGQKSKIIHVIQTYQSKHQLKNIKVVISGKPVLDHSIQTSMKQSMKEMLALSIIFMIIVLSLIFKVRWRLLPLFIILLAVAGTIGLMGWFHIPMTMVSMAVFPILIGLGIDYAIQFQNRYTEEMQKEGEE